MTGFNRSLEWLRCQFNQNKAGSCPIGIYFMAAMPESANKRLVVNPLSQSKVTSFQILLDIWACKPIQILIRNDQNLWDRDSFEKSIHVFHPNRQATPFSIWACVTPSRSAEHKMCCCLLCSSKVESKFLPCPLKNSSCKHALTQHAKINPIITVFVWSENNPTLDSGGTQSLNWRESN